MILVVMSKKFGQISYSIPENTKNLCVSVDDEPPFVLCNHEDTIEPLKSFRIENDEVIRLDPKKKI
jgi:hypothetical protein